MQKDIGKFCFCINPSKIHVLFLKLENRMITVNFVSQNKVVPVTIGIL